MRSTESSPVTHLSCDVLAKQPFIDQYLYIHWEMSNILWINKLQSPPTQDDVFMQAVFTNQ